MKDLYGLLKHELTAVWQLLRSIPISQLSSQEKAIEGKMRQIERLAEEIGGQTQVDVLQLRMDVSRFIQGKMTLAEMNSMIEHSLRVEQDTREL
jgi:hypothetical protein